MWIAAAQPGWTALDGGIPHAERDAVMLISEESDGQHCAVMDVVAVRRMVRIDQPEVDLTPAGELAGTPEAELVRA